MSNTKTIAKNSGWFSIENITSSIVALVTSIAINRYLGPSKNGYIVYVSYIASLVSSLGGMGIPATARKYMAEFIGMGDRGTARYIYRETMRLQAGLATLTTGGLLIWVLWSAAADYKIACALLVLSIWPSMVNTISGQANQAAEDFFANIPASLISTVAYFLAIAATVTLHWGVIGVGGAVLLMRTVDFLIRFFPTWKRVMGWETTHTFPPGLRKRMISFAWQSVASMAVTLIVWGRSEIVLLKSLCPDIRQVSFYSLAFTMAERAATCRDDFWRLGGRDDLRTVWARQVKATCHDFSHLPLPCVDDNSAACDRSIVGGSGVTPSLWPQIRRRRACCDSCASALHVQGIHRACSEPFTEFRETEFCNRRNHCCGNCGYKRRLVLHSRSWRGRRLHWQWSSAGDSCRVYMGRFDLPL